jgi:hypothetical protein
LISKAFCVTKNELISPSNESKDYNPDAAGEFNIAAWLSIFLNIDIFLTATNILCSKLILREIPEIFK